MDSDFWYLSADRPTVRLVGLQARTRKRKHVVLLGKRLPPSHFMTVSGVILRRRANSFWLRFSRRVYRAISCRSSSRSSAIWWSISASVVASTISWSMLPFGKVDGSLGSTSISIVSILSNLSWFGFTGRNDTIDGAGARHIDDNINPAINHAVNLVAYFSITWGIQEVMKRIGKDPARIAEIKPSFSTALGTFDLVPFETHQPIMVFWPNSYQGNIPPYSETGKRKKPCNYSGTPNYQFIVQVRITIIATEGQAIALLRGGHRNGLMELTTATHPRKKWCTFKSLILVYI